MAGISSTPGCFIKCPIPVRVCAEHPVSLTPLKNIHSPLSDDQGPLVREMGCGKGAHTHVIAVCIDPGLPYLHFSLLDLCLLLRLGGIDIKSAVGAQNSGAP